MIDEAALLRFLEHASVFVGDLGFIFHRKKKGSYYTTITLHRTTDAKGNLIAAVAVLGGPRNSQGERLWKPVIIHELNFDRIAHELQRAMHALEEAAPMETRLEELWKKQSEWSQNTFGPDSQEQRLYGALMHLEKEARECLAMPYDLIEKADCLLLIMDATRRSGRTLRELIDAADLKQKINTSRQWSSPVDGKPTEHVRTEEVGQ